MRDDAEARADFWSISGDFICRHHNEPRVQLHVPKEETFTIPLKYMDVTRSTHTNLNVMQEKRIDDHWNVHAKRSFSDSWKGLTKFILLKEKTSKGTYWVWRETDKNSSDHWTRQCVCVFFFLKYGPKFVKPLRREREREREKQEWANEKSKLDNARRLSGIYSLDTEDEEYK